MAPGWHGGGVGAGGSVSVPVARRDPSLVPGFLTVCFKGNCWTRRHGCMLSR